MKISVFHRGPHGPPSKSLLGPMLFERDPRIPIANCDFPGCLDPLSTSRFAHECFAIVVFVNVPLFVCVLLSLTMGAMG